MAAYPQWRNAHLAYVSERSEAKVNTLEHIRKLTFGEILSVIGLLVGVVGQSLYLSVLPGLGNYIRVVGLAVFLGGILVVQRRILSHLQAHRIEQYLEGIVHLLAATALWKARDPKLAHVRATGEVLRRIAETQLPEMAKNVVEFRQAEVSQFTLKDYSPIFDLMYCLGENLPKGGAWFGITLLESEAAWQGSLEDRFIQFRNLMRDRARKKYLSILRLYYFHSEEAYQRLKPMLQMEIDNGLVVRMEVGGEEKPPDISLLWLPPRLGARSRSIDYESPIDSARNRGYRALCALGYDTHDGAHLGRIQISAGDSREFDTNALTFKHHWSLAHPVGPPGG